MVTIRENIIRAIRGHRHRDYDRTIAIAEWSYSMMTGEDQQGALVQYHSRESKAQHEQRIKITSSKTQFASGKVAKIFNEVHRSDTVIDQLYYIDDADNKKRDRLRLALESFSQGTTMKEWIDDQYHYRQFYDPNSVLVTEWTLDEKNVPVPYPLSVDAKDTLDFGIKHGKLQFVVIRQPKWYLRKGSENDLGDFTKKLNAATTIPGTNTPVKKNVPTDDVGGYEMAYKYTCYGIGQTIEFVQLPSEDSIFDPDEYQDFTAEKLTVGRVDKTFLVRELDQNIDFCPVLRWGYFKDPQTKGRTFVSPLYPSEKLYNDLMRNKSEYDLTKALHGFYQKFVYVQKCAKCNGTGEVHNKAKGTVGTCKPCEGKGKLYNQSTQDVVAITLPDKPELMFDLTKLVHFAEIPQYVAEMQKASVDQAVKDIFSAIFNEMLFESSAAPQTATELKLNVRSMYNSLHPYTDHLARMYKQEIFFIHGILEIDGALVNNFAITKDYNMESIGDLFQQRQTAVASGAPQAIIEQIDAKILKKQHQNDPEFLDQYEAIQQLKPLRDKTPTEVMAVISRLDQTSQLAVQWTYFNDIIEAMRAENPGVFKLPYEARKAAFDAMTKQFLVLNLENTPAPSMFM